MIFFIDILWITFLHVFLYLFINVFKINRVFLKTFFPTLIMKISHKFSDGFGLSSAQLIFILNTVLSERRIFFNYNLLLNKQKEQFF